MKRTKGNVKEGDEEKPGDRLPKGRGTSLNDQAGGQQKSPGEICVCLALYSTRSNEGR
jgi:hypothetical protein